MTVYICDSCDSRALGQQYCPDCHTFMRAAGIGAECPCCSSPSPSPNSPKEVVANLTPGGRHPANRDNQ